jgi:hypothetical protein
MGMFWIKSFLICGWAIYGLIILCREHIPKFSYGTTWFTLMIYMIIEMVGA